MEKLTGPGAMGKSDRKARQGWPQRSGLQSEGTGAEAGPGKMDQHKMTRPSY